MQPKDFKPLNTVVYIDGFNLYYSLKNTPYKWLNLEKLTQNVLNPSLHKILNIKYFTAVPKRVDSAQRQNVYIRALKTFERDFLTGMIKYPHSLFGSSGGPLFNEIGEVIGMTVYGKIGCYVSYINSILIKKVLNCFQQTVKDPFCENVWIKRN